MLAVRRVVQDADAIDVVETLGSKWKLENVCLENRGSSFRKIFRRDFGSQAQINAHHVRTPPSRYLRKAAHSAANIENELALQIFRSEPGPATEGALRALADGVIELGPGVELPLEAKAPGVFLSAHEANHAIHHRILASALETDQSIRMLVQRTVAIQTAQDCQDLFSDS